jgi:RNA polymerase sigma factor (sigma-70 family)
MHAPDPSDDPLARWRELGDRAALEDLLAIEIGMLKSRIRAQARHLTDPCVSASDVAQEAVLHLLDVEPPPQFDNPRALRGYLWTTAWRLLSDRLRRAGREIARLDPSQTGSLDSALVTTGGISALENRDRALALQVLINLLEPSEQEILELAYFRGLGVEGAARELGLSSDVVSTRLVRARQGLARKLVRWSELVS